MLSLLPVLPLIFTQATEKLGNQPCTGERKGCYSSYVVLADLDADGDLDAVFASGGGYYEPDVADPMAVYLNDGAATMTESSATATGGFTGRLRQIAIGDIDGDGDQDIVAPDSWAMQADAVFVNNGARPPVFANQGPARLGTSSRAGAVRLGDLDGDGDLDLVITDWGANPPSSAGSARVYLNDGLGTFAELVGALPGGTEEIGTGPIDADLFDADGDFDLDLILASREGESLLFRNLGNGMFESRNAAGSDDLPDQPGPYVYGPDACDVDGDHDLDLWLDNGQSGLAEQLVINDGSGKFTDKTATLVSGDANADDNEVQCVDIDDDGDLDALIASLGDNERFLDNNGSGSFTAGEAIFPTVGDATLGLDVGDLNGDGRLDAITAQGEFGSFLNRLYLGSAEQALDTHAPVIRAVEREPRFEGTEVRVRFAVADRATSDVGPRLEEAWLEVANEKVPAHFVGGDLFDARVVVRGDTLVFKACAQDLAEHTTCSEVVTATRGGSDIDAGPGTPDAGIDAGPGDPDAGPGADASPGADAGPPVDDDGDDGCGCRAGGRSRWADGSLLVLAVAIAFRRRRRRG